MGKIISNGINYSGLINAQGVFIDTNNVIQASTNWTTSMSYTATQDCFVVIENDAQSSHFKATIDGVEIYDYGTSGQYVCIKQPFAVKKGQIFGATTTQSNTLSYTVYGIQQGSHANVLLDYSTDEQFTGQKWVDGKDVYQKSFSTTLPLTPDGGNADSFIVGTGLTGIDNVIEINGTVKDTTNNAWGVEAGLPWMNSFAGWHYSFHLNPSGQLVLWFGVNNTNYYSQYAGGKVVATVKYTKSTT